MRLRCYPTQVVPAGGVAWSSGPALYQRVRPGAQPRYRLGAYRSVWRRGRDGRWRVLFDDGLAPRPATGAEALAFQRGRRAGCPGR